MSDDIKSDGLGCFKHFVYRFVHQNRGTSLSNFVSNTKNVSDFVQAKKHRGQQCVRKDVSTFTRPLI